MAWLADRLERDDIQDVTVESMSSAGGLNCEMMRLLVTYKGGSDGESNRESLVYKRPDANRLDRSKSLGLAREALFYQTLASNESLCSVLPKVRYAKGNLSTGEKEIIMQDLTDGIQSGYFFGPGSPLNWGKDLLEQTRGLSARVSALDVAKVAARAAGEVHGAFFRDASLAGHAWIRGSGWISGEGWELWEAYQKQCRDAWASLDFSAPGVDWDPFLRECVDAAIARAKPENGGFQSFLAWMEKAPWSLVHGDFHPANCMLLQTGTQEKMDLKQPGCVQMASVAHCVFRILLPGGQGTSPHIRRFWSRACMSVLRLILLDWENVGVGSGPQEIAQFLISHMDPSTRAAVEEEVVQEYYKALKSQNPRAAEAMSYEASLAGSQNRKNCGSGI